MHIIYIYIFNDKKIGVMLRGLPWAGDGLAKSTPKGSRAPSCTRISSSYSSMTSLYSCSSTVRTLPTHDLHAWNDDAILSNIATTTLKIKYICLTTKLVLPTTVLSYLLLPITSMKYGIHYYSNYMYSYS